MKHVHEVEFTADLGAWKFRSAAPGDDLRHVVREYWEVEGSLRPFRETLLPNGACEIMFNLGPVHEVQSDQGRGFWTDAWMSGLHERSRIIESLNGTHLVSAGLHPLGATEILGDALARRANGIARLEDVIGNRANDVRASLMMARSATDRLALVEQFLRDLAKEHGLIVPEFLQHAVHAIEQANGKLRVSELHETLGVSRRHLSVTFARFGHETNAIVRTLPRPANYRSLR